MDHTNLRNDSYVDLESGGFISEECESKGLSSSGKKSKKLLKRSLSGILGVEPPAKTRNGRATAELFEPMIGFKGKQFAQKQLNGVKPAKPPRPPKAPSLTAADEQMVKEISKLAMLKRKRVERMKASKKMKKEKTSVLNSNCFAMVVTILFFLFILVQGLYLF